jgi:hypothetical protein
MEVPAIDLAAIAIRRAYRQYRNLLAAGHYADFYETAKMIGAHLDTARTVLKKESGGELTGQFSAFVGKLEFDLVSSYALLNVHLLREFINFHGVYFIQAGKDGPIKIGWTNDLANRLSTFQVANYRTLHVRAVMLGKAAIERPTQRLFRNDRIRGEWFKPSDGLLEYVSDLNRNRVDMEFVPDGLQPADPQIPEAMMEAFNCLSVFIFRHKATGGSEAVLKRILYEIDYTRYIVDGMGERESQLMGMVYGQSRKQLTYTPSACWPASTSYVTEC